MGKKYIIELEREETAYKTVNSNGTPLIQLLAPTPYTEPDLERVRLEAEQLGMVLAWDAVKKILYMPEGDLLELFDVYTPVQVMLAYTASEVIEKLKAYEQEQFYVGDEFETENGKKYVVLKMDGKEIDRYMDSDGRTYHMNVKYKVMRKTGRHFSEITTVLEKLRGEDND